MIDWKVDIDQFFDELRLYEDEINGKCHRQLIRKAIGDFFSIDEKTAPALEVYRLFFEAYWMGIEKEQNPFLQLVKRLKEFEETSGRMVQKHRDHFEHVVNVFLLGLAIYVANPSFREKFEAMIKRSSYKDAYTFPHEEFFYRWGLATLFHDIAYPIELTLKQAKEYVQLLTSYVCEGTAESLVLLNIPGLSTLHEVPLIQPRDCDRKIFCERYPTWETMPFPETAEKLLSNHVGWCFSLPPEEVYKELANQKVAISEKGLVDHGYYGAVTLIKWSHRLVQQGQWNPIYFYYPILESASAILLHNWYKHGLQKPPFMLGPMKCEWHPVAWLLILCDEVQEWGRKEYQVAGGSVIPVPTAEILVGEGQLDVLYQADVREAIQKLTTKEEAIRNLVEINGKLCLRVSVPK